VRTPQEEAALLRRLMPLRVTPQAISYKELSGFSCLSYNIVEGVPLSQTGFSLHLIWRLFGVLTKISAKGVAHRDLVEGNVLVARNGSVFVIDFDQAVETSPFRAFLNNVFGLSVHGLCYGSFFSLVSSLWRKRMGRLESAASVVLPSSALKSAAKAVLPSSAISLLRRFRSSQRWNSSLPRIADSAPTKLHLLRTAWELAQRSNASSPGIPICYYEVWEEGICFPGERPWLERWKYLRSCTNYQGKTILELGSNIGLLSSFLLRDRGAKMAICVDADPHILAASQLVGGAYAVSPISVCLNFDDDENWEEVLELFAPDIVFCLNVLNWVSNKSRMMRFLGKFNEVIFEGHEVRAVHYEQLTKIGFVNVTPIALSERGRDVFLCRKS
jgi:serine/threonine protein kinase